jgi:multicomponent Na+:H+ antiporter subunit A
MDEVRSLVAIQPWTFLSIGLALAVGSALVPLFLGNTPLDQQAIEWHVAVLGKVKATSATIFDSGVYLIVVGLVLMIFEGLGDDADDGASTEDDVS